MWDLAPVDALRLRAPPTLGWADALAAGLALRHAVGVHTVTLWRAGLSPAALAELALALPGTRVASLAVEDNALPPGGATAAPLQPPPPPAPPPWPRRGAPLRRAPPP